MGIRSNNNIWLYLLGGFGFLLFVLVVLAFSDEELTAAARADMAYRSPAIDPKQNAYYALIGLSAEKGLDPWQAGWNLKLEYDKHIKQGGTGFEFDAAKFDWLGKLKVNNKIDKEHHINSWCVHNTAQSCLAFYKKNTQLISDTLTKNKLLLARFQDLYKYTSFRDETEHLFIFGVMDTQQLLQARIGLMWLRNRKQAALDLLDRDLRFWKMVCGSDTGLLHKMIAIAVLDRDMRFYSELLADDPDIVGKARAGAQLLSPLDSEKYGLKAPFRREYQLSAGYMAMVSKDGSKGLFSGNETALSNNLIKLMFFRKNATLNGLHKIYLAQTYLCQQTPDKYIDAVAEYRKSLAQYNNMYRLDMVYNPIGKILLAIAIPAFENYLVTFNNLELTRRLILLQREILQKNIDIQTITAYLQKSRNELHNPYTLQAAQYDQASNELYFDVPIDDHKRVSIRL